MSEIVRDRVAEKLEAAGLWRRAASQWLEVMCKQGNSNAQLEWLRQRRVYCQKQLTAPVAPWQTGTDVGIKKLHLQH